MEPRPENICVIVPTYNNAGTVCDVVGRAVAQGLPVIVVNDGCTDDTAARLAEAALPVTVLTHSRNRGKGVALRTGLQHARQAGFRYAITIDADGQQFPEDIPLPFFKLSGVCNLMFIYKLFCFPQLCRVCLCVT